MNYFEDENLSGSPIDVKFTVGRVVWIDSLSRQEIYDVLRSILIPVGRSDLNPIEINI